MTGTVGVLDRVFRSLPGGVAIAEEDRARAHHLAADVRDSYPDMPDGAAGLCFAVEMLRALPTEAARDPEWLCALVDRLEREVAVPRAVLGRIALAGPFGPSAGGQRVGSDRDDALARVLALLLAVARGRSVTVWERPHGAAPEPRAQAGDPAADGGELPRAATALLGAGGPREHVCGSVFGLRLTAGPERDSAGAPGTALLTAGAQISVAEQRLLLEAAGATVAWLLAPDPSESARAAAVAQRQLTRLRFDLHDGPQQDVLLLAEDLRLFQSQLESVLAAHPLRTRLVGRLEDLKARLVALDGDLRRISSLLLSPFLHAQSFEEALIELTAAFTERTSVVPGTRLEGNFELLTDSQQITLLQLIREALSNIREHSDASVVTIHASAGEGTVDATVTDNGRGFDPETALIEAARGGHLGLVGMHERVAMLGGTTRIDSRPGGPTVISVSLPAHDEPD